VHDTKAGRERGNISPPVNHKPPNQKETTFGAFFTLSLLTETRFPPQKKRKRKTPSGGLFNTISFDGDAINFDGGIMFLFIKGRGGIIEGRRLPETNSR
jgi:hypothetical protein